MPLSTLLFVPEFVNAGTKPLGYPDYFAYTLIIFKVLGAFTIIHPKTPTKLKEWAYAGLTFNLIFAFISHRVVDGFGSLAIFPLTILAILMVSYFYKNRIMNNHITK
ncbi:hypothetical protein A33Q_1636 [Indibacter alkaliphilus LW1]|uniref:DoxX-like family protein n=2 Tax=Indibacter TaxID=647744 RepID=S2DFD6_INDAL|nr:hypothetical protein A33Q_1636 [Indibacter alkaliphilus LW1]